MLYFFLLFFLLAIFSHKWQYCKYFNASTYVQFGIFWRMMDHIKTRVRLACGLFVHFFRERPENHVWRVQWIKTTICDFLHAVHVPGDFVLSQTKRYWSKRITCLSSNFYKAWRPQHYFHWFSVLTFKGFGPPQNTYMVCLFRFVSIAEDSK